MAKPKTNDEWVYEIVKEIKTDVKELKTRFFSFLDTRDSSCPHAEAIKTIQGKIENEPKEKKEYRFKRWQLVVYTITALMGFPLFVLGIIQVVKYFTGTK